MARPKWDGKELIKVLAPLQDIFTVGQERTQFDYDQEDPLEIFTHPRMFGPVPGKSSRLEFDMTFASGNYKITVTKCNRPRYKLEEDDD